MQKKLIDEISDSLRAVFWALALAIIFRSFLFEPFNIPSGSMKPTLLVGDYIFVSKYSYGYSNYSFPFAPNFFKGRAWQTKPKRSDVVVFRPTKQDNVDYIKRIVGLPGDKIQMISGVMYVNGAPVKMKRLDDFYDEDINLNVARYREKSKSGGSYQVLDLFSNGALDNTKIFEVPKNHYFLMGDNRDNSDDSRDFVGFVPIENLIGRAEFVFFSIGSGASFWEIWRWPFVIRSDRFFKEIK